MVVIGVTGSVGTGKSTVAGMFKRLGAVVLDADLLAHRVMEPKRLAWREVADTTFPVHLSFFFHAFFALGGFFTTGAPSALGLA